ncbi:MAG TPA: Rnase Y domain-containing protein [Candidatus Absconditabacterales bacterium]|nr:Rnase Y domain-containing protein [Candidatus Absconditabacterales bacterium]
MNILSIVLIIVALGAGGLGGFYGYKRTLTQKALDFKKRMEHVKEIEEELLDAAKKKADKSLELAEEKAQKIEAQRLEKMEVIQNRLLAREEKMDEKLEKLEQEKVKLSDKQKEMDAIIQEQLHKISDIAKLTKEEAKDQLFSNVEKEYQKDLVLFIDKLKTIKKEEADKEAAIIVAQALPRVAVNSVDEFTTRSIDLPNEDIKGKLIGREGRNIGYFEKMTGVELIVDDTPLTVRVSSFDSEKRYIAGTMLQKLIKDGRINPFYIEKTYNEVVADLQNLLTEKGKEALAMLNIPMMKPELVKMIGQYSLRYSYGQNLWTHSIEVAKISEAIATELGLDPILAKKAGLFHDIGKIIATTGQSHASIGAEVLKKLGMDPVIINAAEAHHYDVPINNPIAWIVAAADAISASRPGARFNTKDLFIEKMGELEKLIYEIPGIDKVHIMQAGREIMVYVNPKEISDIQLEKLLKTIGEKIEEKLDYPGIIRVTGIRETKIIEFLR